jgi:hypothetical protein
MQAPRRVCAALEKESSQSAFESNKNFAECGRQWFLRLSRSDRQLIRPLGLMRLIGPIRRDLLSLY